LLALKPRKFAVAFSLGSLLFMVGCAPPPKLPRHRSCADHAYSFALLQGPIAHIKHILSPERLPFSAAYFGSLGLTLFFAVGVRPPFS
jgi:hypothetical protein